jgi:hypothetical protein
LLIPATTAFWTIDGFAATNAQAETIGGDPGKPSQHRHLSCGKPQEVSMRRLIVVAVANCARRRRAAFADILSQVLTLFTTPIMYIYLDRAGGWLRRRGHDGEPSGTARRASRPLDGRDICGSSSFCQNEKKL